MCKVDKLKEPNLNKAARPIYYYINKNGCYICTSHRKDRDGYTRVERLGKEWLMHRYIYYLKYGDIPDGIVIMHLCDNPACNNIRHLKAGTQKDNMRDMVSKDRNAKSHKRTSKQDLKYIEEHFDYTISRLAVVLNISHSTVVSAKRKIRTMKSLKRNSSKPLISHNKKDKKIEKSE